MAFRSSVNLLGKKFTVSQKWARNINQSPTENLAGVHIPEASSRVRSTSLPVSQYGGRHMVTMLAGDGIGPEHCGYIHKIFKKGGFPVDFEIVGTITEYLTEAEKKAKAEEEAKKRAERQQEQNFENRDEYVIPIPIKETNILEEAYCSLLRNRVGIKANLTNVITKNDFVAPNVFLRSQLNLPVYYVHYKAYPNVRCFFPDLDLMLIRQNTEGEYKQLEHESTPGYVEAMKIVTRDTVEKLARWAFDHAVNNERKRITVVHKNRVMPLSDGLFVDTVKEVSKSFPAIEVDEVHVDTLCHDLVQNPHRYDVLLAPNLYGTIISNIICGILGGAGLFSGANLGKDIAVFEPATRHTGKGLVGKKISNPTGMVSAAVNMLKHLKEDAHAKLLEDALITTVCKRNIQTPDIGGTHSTTDVVDAIMDFIAHNSEKYIR